MKIKITQKHIDEGQRALACLCPVALALREATGLNASVYQRISLWKDRSKYLYQAPTPPRVMDRIHNYDKNKLMVPFEFEINYENQSHSETH